MRIDIVSIFPDYLSPLNLSLVGKAIRDGKVEVEVHDLRNWAQGPHRQVDDTPYGGGPGMVMSAQVWGDALDSVQANIAEQGGKRPVLIIPTPSGEVFGQALAQELAEAGNVVFACGRYEGIDARIAQHYAEAPAWSGVREVSIGDYVLAGGEVAALVMIEAVVRLIPGVLGNPDSAPDDSFSRPDGLVEGAVYTKPATWRGLEVPEALQSGNHARIEQWRTADALARTRRYRPDLLEPDFLEPDFRAQEPESQAP